MRLKDAADPEQARRARLEEDLRSAGGGDRDALERVYQATSAKLFGVCLRILREREAAEEVLQEVYLTVWRKADQFDSGKASPVTWLCAIARNKAIDRLRERGGPPLEPLDAAVAVEDGAPRPDASLETSQGHQRLSDCLGRLDPRHAGIIRTAFWEGVTYDRLAVREGVPAGTLKSWIRRGLLSLRGCLEP